MKKLLYLCLIASSCWCYAQGEVQAEVGLGFGFQNDVTFNTQNYSNPHSLGGRFGLNYQYLMKKNWYVEMGLFGIYDRSHYRSENVSFTSNRFSLQIPFYLGYNVTPKLKLSAGASIGSNKDIVEINFKDQNNLRYDLITKLVYVLNSKVQLSFYNNWMLNKSPDIYTYNHPRNGLYAGVIYILEKRKIKK